MAAGRGTGLSSVGAAASPGGRVARSLPTLTAYLLHRYDWSESSVIIDLFTREQGRVVVVAKGAKRPYSQLRSVLLPFQRVHVALARAPRGEEYAGEVRTLRSAEWAGGIGMLSGAALFNGFYLNELLLKLLARQDPHLQLFDAYAQTVQTLASASDRAAQAALRAFELTLLQEIGLLPDLSVTTPDLAALIPGGRYTLQPERGVDAWRVEAEGEPVLSGAALIGLQAALEHGSLEALQQACSGVLPALKNVLRGLLHYHLGGASLRTRQVMMDLLAFD